MAITGLIFGAIAYCANQQSVKEAKKREETMKEKLNIVEGMNEDVACSLNDDEKVQLKDWFMEKKWRIDFSTKDKSFKDFAELKVIDLKEKSMNSYWLKIEAKDSIGKSDLEGILIHKADYFAIYFFKTYHNRSDAGQTGAYEWLVYDGVKEKETFVGKWFYEGFENSPDYSGTWLMIHQ